jgi:hypothetical protein
MTRKAHREPRDPAAGGTGWGRVWRVFALLAVGAVGFGISAAAGVASPLSWTRTQVDGNRQAALIGVSCASLSLCVAVDNGEDVVSSTSPTAGASAWKTVPGEGGSFLTVSCPSTSLCLAADEYSIYTSTNPAGPASSWTPQQGRAFPELKEPGVEYLGPLASIACASTSQCVANLDSYNDFDFLAGSSDPAGGETAWPEVQPSQIHGSGNSRPHHDPVLSVSCGSPVSCVAVDAAGNVLVSTGPWGSESVWTVAGVDTNPIWGVSCVSSALCVAVDGAGSILVSTDPAGGAGRWSQANIDAPNRLRGVSCASLELCVAVDGAGNILVSTDPAGGAEAWSSVPADAGHALLGVSCIPAGLCVAVDDAGDALTATFSAPAGGGQNDGAQGEGAGAGAGARGTPVQTPTLAASGAGTFKVSHAKVNGSGQIALTVTAPTEGTISALATIMTSKATAARSSSHRYGFAAVATRQPAAVTLTINPTKAAQAALRSRTLHVHIAATFHPHTGAAATAYAAITIHRHKPQRRRFAVGGTPQSGSRGSRHPRRS